MRPFLIARLLCAGLALTSSACDGQLSDSVHSLRTLGGSGATADRDELGRGRGPKPTIVLVHGAFADGSSWQELIPLLQHDGFTVVAVQNTLTSLANDIITTRRVIDAQVGPVVVVGHSYGGAVVTGAATGGANVKALVYIAAFAPDANEPIGALNAKYPSDLGAALRPDAAGYLYIDGAAFHDVFAADLPLPTTRVMAVEQKPLNSMAFGEFVTVPAWKSIPSWYVVATQDHAISPDLERFYAKRMGAKTTELRSSHVPFLSQPEAIVKVIRAAAEGM